ncbi:hypothetical protein B0H10DRAFT_101143 [Mycena sp. CBHHK59/15]|nr:hypothetical protein B0H10DRAFT_101143 [Mycena sp. CBHHK59/15]
MPPPKSLLLLNVLSLSLAVLTLLLSLWDLGILSLWLGPTASVLTIAYHTTVLLLTHKRPELSVMHTVPTIALAYLLSVVWLGTFAVMVIIDYGNEDGGQIAVFCFNIQFPSSVRDTQQLQFILAPMETCLLGDIAIRSTIQRRSRNSVCFLFFPLSRQ